MERMMMDHLQSHRRVAGAGATEGSSAPVGHAPTGADFAASITLGRCPEASATPDFRAARRRWGGRIAASTCAVLLALSAPRPLCAEPPAPPKSIEAKDHPWDGGASIDVAVGLSPNDLLPGKQQAGADTANAGAPRFQYLVQHAGELDGHYTDIAKVEPQRKDYKAGSIKVQFDFDKSERGEPYFFRARAIGPDGSESAFVRTEVPIRSSREWFDGSRMWMAVVTLVICSSVVLFIAQARRGKELKIRRIAGLDAVDEAVGRATEMGRSVLFVPGIQDMNDMQTIAGITILGHVAQVAADYVATVEVPTSRSLVMTAARETVEAAFLTAGRPDAYREDDIYYVTDEQFGYVAYLSGMMVRKQPAACFYLGSFFAESLILAETGNSIDAIQVAGTAQPSQLPFFVASCDYTLIGEEFFAASAYLSGDPDQLGSLKGQDVGKLIVGALLIVGCIVATLAVLVQLADAQGMDWIERARDYLRDTMLK